MATIKLVRVKLEGAWPNNSQPDVRFVSAPIAGPIQVPQINVWENYSPSNNFSFNAVGFLRLYLNGMFLGSCSSSLSPNIPRTNAEATIPTGYGLARVIFNVVV